MSKLKSVEQIPITARVRSNLLQQDCYVRDCSLKSDVIGVRSSSEYLTLNEKVTQTGLTQEVVSVPYPITPQSVNSYVESCDYRRDPLGAIMRGGSRVNLGDVTALQDVSSMDAGQARDLYVQLQARFAQSQNVVSQNVVEEEKEDKE